MNHIVKRAGHSEPYDLRKLYASIYSACLSVRETPPTAELIAERVVKEFDKWLEHKHEVTSNDIRRVAGKYLTAINSDAGYMYLHHRVIY